VKSVTETDSKRSSALIQSKTRKFSKRTNCIAIVSLSQLIQRLKQKKAGHSASGQLFHSSGSNQIKVYSANILYRVSVSRVLYKTEYRSERG